MAEDPAGEERTQISLVIDANVVFACFSRFSFTRRLISNNPFYLFAPNLLRLEVNKHKPEFLFKMHLSSIEFDELRELLFQQISFIEDIELVDFAKEALALSPDPEDSPYFQIALKFGIPLWSNDLLLKKQGRVRVFTTAELLNYFGFSINP